MPARSPTMPAVARGAVALLIAVAVGVAGCGRQRTGDRGGWPWRERREDYLRRSAVWVGGDLEEWVRRMDRLDLRSGPSGLEAFAPEALVRCGLVEPHDADTFSGKTPKFLCRRDGADEVFKVKWGKDNGEIYADAAGTRLFWALGFPTDRIYPVSVECAGCADDPWRDRLRDPGHAPRLFAPAIVELEFAGETIEQTPHQGWTWAELARVDPAAGGAPRAHTDALRLLAAFVQHRDSKADNQRLVCPPDAVIVGSDDGSDCRQPVMLIDDLGSAFGGPSVTATHKMDLDAWRHRPVWKDPTRCIADVTSERDADDGLDLPPIGEGGRRFLARLLGALEREQVKDLFEVSRAGARGELAEWVETFEDRRRQIEHPLPSDPAFRCPGVDGVAAAGP